jgi:hypothetical protein
MLPFDQEQEGQEPGHRFRRSLLNPLSHLSVSLTRIWHHCRPAEAPRRLAAGQVTDEATDMISHDTDIPKPRADVCPQARFRVAWRHDTSGMVNVGRLCFATYPAAAEFAEAMNNLWPEVPHWPIPAGDADSRA